MIDDAAVKLAMASGLPITCATCRFWHAGDGLCGKVTCGGPPNGRDFPDYDGPIPRELLRERCLICGVDAEFLLLVPGGTTGFGLCDRHQSVFDHIKPLPGTFVSAPIVLALPGR